MAKKKTKENTGLVRIDTNVTEQVKKHIKVTRQTVGGFYAVAALEKLDKEKKS